MTDQIEQPACTTCQQPIGWISCPTGGWWAHEQHPADGHDAQPYLRDEIAQALSEAGAFCGECGFQPGETGCPDCVRVRHLYVEAVVGVVQPRLNVRAKIRKLEAELDQLRAHAAADRKAFRVLRRMMSAWEQRLPATIRTAVAVEAVRGVIGDGAEED
jgi:hypothetical protein